eukprot:6565070-Pyramimonas_sp.AAC.1
MLEAFDKSYISKHWLSSQILSSVYKPSLPFLGCAAMSDLVSRSSSLTTTARLAADDTYTLIVATILGSSCASWA